MSDTKQPADALAREILAENPEISPMFSEVVHHIKLYRECGLPDEKIRETVPGMFRLRESAADTGAMTAPAPDEIRVLSMPREYQRDDWS